MTDVLVIKIGGSIYDRAAEVAGEIADLAGQGYKVVLVHGGGRIVDEYSRRMGVEPKIVRHPSGLTSRYTSWEELEVFVMVMAGLINKTITARLMDKGVKALGITGLDMGMVKAKKRDKIIIINEKGRPQAVKAGYTGKIESVDGEALSRLLNNVDVLVVSPIAWGLDEGRTVPLNVDGDHMASRIAPALKAQLLLVTDVPGLLVDGKVVPRLSPDEAEEIAKKVGRGMNRKLIEAARAVREGSPRAVIGSTPLKSLAEAESGTVIEP